MAGRGINHSMACHVSSLIVVYQILWPIEVGKARQDGNESLDSRSVPSKHDTWIRTTRQQSDSVAIGRQGDAMFDIRYSSAMCIV